MRFWISSKTNKYYINNYFVIKDKFIYCKEIDALIQ